MSASEGCLWMSLVAGQPPGFVVSASDAPFSACRRPTRLWLDGIDANGGPYFWGCGFFWKFSSTCGWQSAAMFLGWLEMRLLEWWIAGCKPTLYVASPYVMHGLAHAFDASPFAACRRLWNVLDAASWRLSCLQIQGDEEMGSLRFPAFSIPACRRHMLVHTGFLHASIADLGLMVDPGSLRSFLLLWHSWRFCTSSFLTVEDFKFLDWVPFAAAAPHWRSFPRIDRDDATNLVGTDGLVDADPGEHAWLFLLLWLQQVFTGGALSCCALSLASLLRLLFHGLQLKGGNLNWDPWIRFGRAILFGAPISFWMRFQTHGQGAPGRPGHPVKKLRPGRGYRADQSGLCLLRRFVTLFSIFACANAAGGLDDVDQAANGQTSLDASIARLDDRISGAQRSLEELTRRWLGDDPPAPLRPPQDDSDIELPEVRIPVRILRYQKCEVFIEISAAPGTDSELVMARISEAVLDADTRDYLTEVYPQPDDEMITVLLVPLWWRSPSTLPILIDPTEIGRPMFMSVIPRRATFC